MLIRIFKKYQNEHYKKYPPLKVKRLTPEQAEALQKQEGVTMQPIENKSGEVISKANAQNTVKYCDDNIDQSEKQSETKKVPDTKPESEDFGVPLNTNIDEKYKDISTFNGAKNDKYSWSQDIRNLTVSIKLEREVKGKDLIVNWDPKQIEIMYAKDKHVILKGDF